MPERAMRAARLAPTVAHVQRKTQNRKTPPDHQSTRLIHNMQKRCWDITF